VPDDSWIVTAIHPDQALLAKEVQKILARVMLAPVRLASLLQPASRTP
jgi:hypothetical protein